MKWNDLFSLNKSFTCRYLALDRFKSFNCWFVFIKRSLKVVDNRSTLMEKVPVVFYFFIFPLGIFFGNLPCGYMSRVYCLSAIISFPSHGHTDRSKAQFKWTQLKKVVEHSQLSLIFKSFLHLMASIITLS